MTMEDLQRLLCPRRCRCAAIQKSRREQCRRALLPRRESWTHVAYLTAVPLADAAAVGAMPEAPWRGAPGPPGRPPRLTGRAKARSPTPPRRPGRSARALSGLGATRAVLVLGMS